MKMQTEEAIAALNDAPLMRGGGSINMSKYVLVERLADARTIAESSAWERVYTNAYNGIFIGAIHPVLKSSGVVMGSALEKLHESLSPAIKRIRLDGWSGATRFPFEGLLADCCAELEFSDVLEPVFFYPLVFPVLVAGHFPCGWEGDPIPEGWVPSGPQDLPRGKLMVHLIAPESV